MIPFLARVFRAVHGIIGITAPEPGRHEAAFVLLWLGLILFVLAFCAFLFYLMMNVF
jgi:hypothetical protein